MLLVIVTTGILPFCQNSLVIQVTRLLSTNFRVCNGFGGIYYESINGSISNTEKTNICSELYILAYKHLLKK